MTSLPHIPENPTDEEIVGLLDYMGNRLTFRSVVTNVQTTAMCKIVECELVPVVDICWLALIESDRDLAVVIIDGMAHKVHKCWLTAEQEQMMLDQQKVLDDVSICLYYT